MITSTVANKKKILVTSNVAQFVKKKNTGKVSKL